MSLVVPAVLPSSHKELEEKLALFARIPSISRVQIDVVDGRFATPASWPYNAPAELEHMVERGEMLPYLDRFEYEVDLMCFDALAAAAAWLALGATRLTFHTESAVGLAGFLASARKRYGGSTDFASTPLVSFGLALNIDSNIGIVRSCLGDLAYVQFMGIRTIGRQGQPFDERVFKKIETFHAVYPALPSQVDGGVSLLNAQKLVDLGVTNLVIGSALLKARDPAAAFAEFEALKSPYGV